jgi:hypothetical protein
MRTRGDLAPMQGAGESLGTDDADLILKRDRE